MHSLSDRRNLGGETPGSQPSILCLENLTVAYEERIVLSQINLSVQRGEFIGVIGPNGAGKSTLIRAIAGLVPTQRGTIRFDATRIGAGKSGGHRTSVGYVPQRFELDPDLPLRARDLVGLGYDGHRFGLPLPSRARSAAIQRALELVDAIGFADAPAGRLSGGQLQRVLIAQAMVSEPSLLLLDEPLASLDLRSADAIVEVVDRVAHDSGVGVLLVTHDMNPLLKAMDRIIYVVHGKAVMGSVAEVVKKEVLSQLYGYEVDVLEVRGRILVVGEESPEGQAMGSHHGPTPLDRSQ